MPAGRPPKLTKALIRKIADCFLVAFTDAQTAAYCGISERTIRRYRAGQLCPAIKYAELEREMRYRKQIWAARGYWQGAAWFLERKYPEQFAKPEIQLGIQNNFTQNNLSITISSGEAKELEAQAEPVRSAVKEMFEKYRPALENSNGHKEQAR